MLISVLPTLLYLFFCCLSSILLVQTAFILFSFCTYFLVCVHCSFFDRIHPALCLASHPPPSLVLVSYPFSSNMTNSFLHPPSLSFECRYVWSMDDSTFYHRLSSPWSPYLTHSVLYSYVVINKKSVLEDCSHIVASKSTLFFSVRSLKS